MEMRIQNGDFVPDHRGIPQVVDGVVFWSKNPAPLLPLLGQVPYPFYFQFTLTPYGPEIEPGLRDKRAIVETFQALGRRLGVQGGIGRGGRGTFCPEPKSGGIAFLSATENQEVSPLDPTCPVL